MTGFVSSRRSFLTQAGAAAVFKGRGLGQALAAAPTTRPNIAVIDRARILKAAQVDVTPLGGRETTASAAFLQFSLSLPALAAASVFDAASRAAYDARAAAQLRAWFLADETRLEPAPKLKNFEPVEELAALAEVCVAIPFLRIEPASLAAIKAWFKERLAWLMEDRTALLARDARNHHGSSWLLQTAAAARLVGNDAALSECRHRFKTITVRAQIDASGLFPHELTSENPYRNSLDNLDLLAGACQLLSTQFESLWEHELQDGPGMRSATARHAFYIANRNKWPYPADVRHFNLLPGRRPVLVFAGRAFGQAEYVSLWRTLDPDPVDPEILRAFPIRQPLLWLTQPRLAAGE